MEILSNRILAQSITKEFNVTSINGTISMENLAELELPNSLHIIAAA